jgi:hypothetical protein
MIKKGLAVFLALAIVFSLGLAAQAVAAANNKSFDINSLNLTDAQKEQLANSINEELESNFSNDDIETELRNRTHSSLGSLNTSNLSIEDLKNIKKEIKQDTNFTLGNMTVAIRIISEKRKEIITEKINAITDLNLSSIGIGSKSILMAILSNGRNAIVRIMPNKASEIALAKLNMTMCNETNNCIIILKEVGAGNNTNITYEIQVEKKARLLYLFAVKEKVRAEVNAETGEISDESIKRPWWAFMAKEEDETAAAETNKTD